MPRGPLPPASTDLASGSVHPIARGLLVARPASGGLELWVLRGDGLVRRHPLVEPGREGEEGTA